MIPARARGPRRSSRARPVVGDRRFARRADARRAGRRRDQGRAARRRSVPGLHGLRGVEPVAAIGDASTSSIPTGPSRVPQARGRRRRARRDVPSRRDRPARHRVRRVARGATRGSSTARARRIPKVTASRGRPGYDALVQAEQRPAVGAAGLAPRSDLPAHADAEHGRDVPRADRHPRRAHRARGHRARPARAHVAAPGRVPLHHADLDVGHQGAGRLLDDHGQDVPAGQPPADDLRGRRRRVGAHVDDERPRADPQPGRHPRCRRRGVEQRAVRACSRPRSATQITPRRARPRTARTSATSSSTSSSENNHAIEAIVPMGDVLGGGPSRRRTRSSSPTAWSSPSTIPSSGTRRRSACRSTSPARRARSRAASAARASTTTRSSARSATRAPTSKAFTWMAERTALEGVTLIDFGQYLAGPFGPMIIGDLGADVIKVEPVTGDGMRFVNQPFIGLSARQARHRARTSRAEARRRDRAQARRARRHRAPQHDRRRRRPPRHRLRRLQGRQPRRRVLQHVRVRARGSARALRRARPAVPGVGRARVRVGAGARGQPADVLPLRHDRHGQRDAVGRRVPRRAVPPAPHRRGSGAVDVAARRRRDVRVRRAARRRRARARAPARP